MMISAKDLTLEQKVGQLFMVGFSGTRVTPEVRRLLRDLYVGGVILFKHNLRDRRQTQSLIQKLQGIALKATGLPLFVAIDEEGGPIVRLPKGSPIFPGPMAISATRNIDHVTANAKATANELKILGFNLNFAPVLDVASEPLNPVIGVRSFGEARFLVSQSGAAYIKALQSQGVLATAKHFPGLGACTADPHFTLPIVLNDHDRIEKNEVPPFRAAIKSGVSSVMVSNAYYPALERESGLPACLSKPIVSGMLRKQLGFDGLILTDDLTMGAVSRRISISEASLRSLKAGCDILLICRHPLKQVQAFQAILRAFQSTDLSEQRLKVSLDRILEAKTRIILPSLSGKRAGVRSARQVYEQSITLVRTAPSLIPLPLKLEGFLGLILPKVSEAVPMDPEEEPSLTLSSILSKHYKVRSIRIGIKPTRGDFQMAKALAQSSAAIVFGSYNALESRLQAKLVGQLSRLNKNLIVVSLRNPYDLAAFPEVSCYLAAYSFRQPAMEALAKVLLGQVKPRGVLPVTIPGI